MGGAISTLFGGGMSTPDTPSYDPVPVREEAKDPESKAVRDNERRKLAARRGMSGTILTSPLGSAGSSGTSSGSGGGILGRSV